jgi:hypothetical protein
VVLLAGGNDIAGTGPSTGNDSKQYFSMVELANRIT